MIIDITSDVAYASVKDVIEQLMEIREKYGDDASIDIGTYREANSYWDRAYVNVVVNRDSK